MTPKSDYTYTIEDDILAIVDLNLGRMSVTNNIENVIAEIAEERRFLPEEVLVIYRDSEELWDGWDTKTESFILLQTCSKDEAKRLIRQETP